ncbi:CDP-alcohol phosphatidyltransferase family protein [Paracoccus aestuariivivens]|uniref:CDP-alcohol phosphatidyltransferase family protein n=2 Tax=Paracoccus aestuariivivens TaxID=1820333 RepID=A0A6L6J416_9RHOB|nr:CDP-alcohol phosphatidyltransferase family protein [Paracoccus aestuariivivens]
MVAQLMRQHYPHLRMGACNFVTLMRLALTCGLLAPLLAGNAGGYGITGFALFALALDGVDGWLARRSGLVSGFGARFDIEVDAAFALVLSLHALSIGSIGPEILLLGFMRYAFVAAGLLLPWLAAPLPFSHRRRLVCIVQMVVLIALQLPVLPEEFALLLTWLAVFALLWSFGADILWLRRECR